jgi:transposase-like protein
MSKGRKKRQYYSGEQKVSILKQHLVEREEVSKICDELELHPTVFYDWQRRFFENGMKAFESEEKQESKQLRDKVEALEAKLKRKDSALAELVEELITEKKEMETPDEAVGGTADARRCGGLRAPLGGANKPSARLVPLPFGATKEQVLIVGVSSRQRKLP